MTTFDNVKLTDLERVASEIVRLAKDEKIWRLEGEMGAGKTTFVSALGKHFQLLDSISSPTFSLVNEYRNSSGQIFYHFDFFRIKNEQEALDIGLWEYLDSGNYCWIEWASNIENLLPETYLWVEILTTNPHERSITVRKHGRV
ncbi:MAG: tRNA (adenosine(37)-N6)-threonylcarbamoyltransferase complex ATPase subunit type 1 TsaE [Flammeovirgaceae bacterium]|nr:tRNA (adenosine(37)-N6)-threonylcarbamoyltransferase complex ATPase subunit type 1 TsaE [Flammeovirgaceae bacterium]